MRDSFCISASTVRISFFMWLSCESIPVYPISFLFIYLLGGGVTLKVPRSLFILVVSIFSFAFNVYGRVIV